MLSLSKIKIVFVLSVIMLIVVVAFVFLFFSTQKRQGYIFTNRQIPTPSVIDAPYNNLNLLVPGKNTIEDVDKIAGRPTSLKKEGYKTYLYYNTPVGGDKNTVLLLNNVVYYVSEYVFGNYRGNYSSYTKNYGNPDFVLYENLYPWYVFLKNGIMIQSVNNFITRIVYFVPQAEDDFYKNVASDFNLSRDNLENAGEAIPGP